MTLGAIGFAISLLITQRRDRTSFPLVAFLLALLVLAMRLVAARLGPSAQVLVLAASLPAAFLVGPTLWLYVSRLTGRPPPSRRIMTAHLSLPGAGCVVVLGFMCLPASDRTMMLVRGDLPGGALASVLALAAFVLVLSWVPQSGIYLFLCVQRLFRHRERLESFFSSADEGCWLKGLSIVFLLVWLAAVIALLSDNLLGASMIDASIPALTSLMMVWCLSLWALRARPKMQTPSSGTAKYARSALSEARVGRLVCKLDALMIKERLFLNPDLNLADLAGRLGSTRNHVSQALNGALGETFFDYINRHRIEEAKLHLVDGKKTVVEISNEVGFHARSSFYKAFKKTVGMTPSAYRKQSRSYTGATMPNVSSDQDSKDDQK
ncbi:MAG: helix-turn-helix transcriptional regulator [Myxococcota bacterium]